MVWKKILLEGDAAELSDIAPLDVAKQTASEGVAIQAARQDHLHDLDLSASGMDELGVPVGPVIFGEQEIQSIGLEKVGALPAGFDAQMVFLTTDDHPYIFVA